MKESLQFEKIGRNIVMGNGNGYLVPKESPNKVNSIRVKAGILSFGYTNIVVDFFQSAKKHVFGRFLLG